MKSVEELQQSLGKSKDEINHEFSADFLKKTVDRLVMQSKWFTGVGLALLGFFTALLVQLKLSGIEPVGITALIALITLSISLVSGFWIKLCSMKDDIINDLFPAIKKILEKKLEVKLGDKSVPQTPDEIVESIYESLPTSLIIVQAATLLIAIGMVCFYFMNFLI